MTMRPCCRYMPMGRFFGIMVALLLASMCCGPVPGTLSITGGATLGFTGGGHAGELFRHLQKQSFRFYDQHRTGHLMSRVVNDLFEVVELAHHGPEDLFISLLTLVGGLLHPADSQLAAGRDRVPAGPL